MAHPPLPAAAAWRHLDARDGCEVATFEGGAETTGAADPTFTVAGTTTAVEDGEAWIVSYRIVVDAQWRTRAASVETRGAGRAHALDLLADGEGGWTIDGADAAHLDGCLDVDLESSALTNTLPVHRLELGVGARAEAPAAYVRANDLRVERLEQSYERLEDDVRGRLRYRYAAPSFDVTCELSFGDDLLVERYPGLARRLPVGRGPPAR